MIAIVISLCRSEVGLRVRVLRIRHGIGYRITGGGYREQSTMCATRERQRLRGSSRLLKALIYEGKWVGEKGLEPLTSRMWDLGRGPPGSVLVHFRA